LSEAKPPGTDPTQLAFDRTVSETASNETTVSASAATLPIVERSFYVRGKPIASGGMGRIIEARDTRLDRVVAIKELLVAKPQLAVRFEREVLISARLEHPSIVAVYEAGRWPDGEPFYAMKRVVGRALDKVIEKYETLADRLALIPNVLAVFDALAYAHGKQIIHRDLKPANVLIGEHGETVVIDWGLAKDLGAADDSLPPRNVDAAQTLAGAVLGTPAYMAPEQARGEVVDERADVYALGAMLYFVLAGKAPYAGESAETILAAVVEGGAPPVRGTGIPDDLATIVETAMARDPAQRYPSARELAEDLRRFQTGQLVGRHDYTQRELFGRWVRKHRVAVAVALAMLVVSGILLALAFRRISEERDRAEADETWARMQASQQRVARAKSLLDGDPASALDVLRDLPIDTRDHIQRDAWLVAVATTGTVPAREVHVSPGSGYLSEFVMADGSVLGLRDLPAPPTERLHPPIAVERLNGAAAKLLPFELHDLDPVASNDREWLVWREADRTRAWNIREAEPHAYPFVAETIEATDDASVVLRGAPGCEVLELATSAVKPCPSSASVAFDNATHTLTAIGVDGVRHTQILPGNVMDQSAFGYEPNLRLAPDGRAFVIGLGDWVDPVTVLGDIELAHLTTVPSRLLEARFVSNDRAFVVTRSGVLDVRPHDKAQIHTGYRGFDFTSADISANARWAVTTGRHDISLWDVAAFSPTKLPGTQPGEIYGAAVANDGSSIVTSANDRSLRVWRLERGSLARLPIGGDPDGFVVIDDRMIVTIQTRSGHTLIAWTPGGAPIEVDVPHAADGDIFWTTTNGTSPPIAASGDRIAAMMGSRLELVDLASASHVDLAVQGYPARLAFSPDGTKLLAAGATLQVWDVVSHASSAPPGNLAAWLGDGRLVTADRGGAWLGGAKLDLGTCKPSGLDARDALIAIGCADGTLRVVHLGGKIETFSRATGSALAVVAIGPSGAVAAAGSRPEILVVEPGRGAPVVLYGETRAVTKLHWAGDVLESATPSDSWIWDPLAANGGAKLPSGAKILVGSHHAFVANDEEHIVRATPLPPRLAVGFRAWTASRSR